MNFGGFLMEFEGFLMILMDFGGFRWIFDGF